MTDVPLTSLTPLSAVPANAGLLMSVPVTAGQSARTYGLLDPAVLATVASVTTAINNALASYVTSTALTTSLASYLTISAANATFASIAAVNTALASYATHGDVTAALSGYATNAAVATAISNALTQYSTTTQMNTAIAAAIAAAGGGYTLPAASPTVRGGVKVDNTTITIAGDVISAVGGASTPIATNTVAGKVKGGGNITIAGDGTLNAPAASGGVSFDSVPNIIYNDDQGGDCDGVRAMGILARMHKLGYINLVACVTSINGVAGAGVMYQVIRSVLGANAIPIGYDAVTSQSANSNNYANAVGGRAWGASPSDTPVTFPSGPSVIRTSLSSLIASGKKAIIVTTGPLTSVYAALVSPADGISTSTGQLLFQQGVSGILTMGGHSPGIGGGEYNLALDAAAAAAMQTVLAGLGVRIEHEFISFEIGGALSSHPPVNAEDPVSAAYTLQRGSGVDNYGWDIVAAVVACMRDRSLYRPSLRRGTNTIDASSGANSWSLDPGLDTFLTLDPNISISTVSAMIEAIYAKGSTPIIAPAAPTIQVNAALTTANSITLSCAYNPAGGAPTTYQYQRSTDNGATFTNIGSPTFAPYVVTSAVAGAKYQALAINSAGTSGASNVITPALGALVTAGTIRGLVLNGSGDGGMSTPDVASVQQGGGLLEYQALIVLTASVNGYARIVSKEDGGGGIGFSIYNQGISVIINSNAYSNNNSNGISTGTPIWVRMVRNRSSMTRMGFPPNSINFTTSSDGAVWSSYSVGDYSTPIDTYEAAVPLTIGAATGQRMPGFNIKHVRIIKDGVVTLDVDFTGATAGALTTTAATGQLFTTITGGTSYLIAGSGPAETATITDPTGPFQVGVQLALSGTVANGSSVWVTAIDGGAEEGARIAATVNTGAGTWTANYTPSQTGSTTFAVFAAATGGAALATSPAHNVVAAGSGTTISSITIAANGTAVTMVLSQPAALANVGSLTATINGSADGITWTAAGTAANTFTGTLAATAFQGQTATYSAATNFTSPALAAAVSNAAITNNSTQSAGGGGLNAFNVIFAGAAGQSTGQLALTPAFNSTPAYINLDGSGNLIINNNTGASSYGLFEALGTHSDGAFSMSGFNGNSTTVPFYVDIIFRAIDPSNFYYVRLRGSGTFDYNLTLYKVVSGSETAIQDVGVNSGGWNGNFGLRISGQTFSFTDNAGKTTVLTGDGTYTAAGYVGIGVPGVVVGAHSWSAMSYTA